MTAKLTEKSHGQRVFLCGSFGKEFACNAIPGLGRSPGEGKGYLLQYSNLENSMDCVTSMGSQRVGHDWATFISLHFMNREAWQAIVHGGHKSCTRLCHWTTTNLRQQKSKWLIHETPYSYSLEARIRLWATEVGSSLNPAWTGIIVEDHSQHIPFFLDASLLRCCGFIITAGDSRWQLHKTLMWPLLRWRVPCTCVAKGHSVELIPSLTDIYVLTFAMQHCN